MTLNEIIELIESKTRKIARKTGSGYTVCCPSHQDMNPSLSISEGTDGKILVKCFAGCSTDAICDSLGIKVSELFPIRISSENKNKYNPIKYFYYDEQGKLLFSKVRIEPGFDGQDKSFYWERKSENGEIVKNLKGCRKLLYRLPELFNAIEKGKTIYLTEGEKDTNKLINHGLAATSAPESLKWSDEFTETLKDADVAILYDLDKTGIERKDLLCKRLYKKVKRLRVVDLPGLEYQESHGKDVSDWLSEGNTIAQLVEITNNTPNYISSSKKSGIRVVSLDEFLNMELPKREMLLAPFLPKQGLCLLYAKRGVGKTHVALGIAYAVASGGEFLKWHAPSPKRVLYLDGEMPAKSMQERLTRIAVSEDKKLPSPEFLRLITPDLQESPMPDLSTKEGRIILEEFIGESDLIIIDNISTLFRSGIENEAESWKPVQDWALELRRKGKSVLFVHHAAKGGQQRGTSKKEDILDAVVTLKQPSGYRSDEGAYFEVIFEKTRHFSGEDAASFNVNLCEQEDGLWIWKIEESSIDSEVLAVVERMNRGLTIEKIAQETGLTKSQVETRQKKAREQELI